MAKDEPCSVPTAASPSVRPPPLPRLPPLSILAILPSSAKACVLCCEVGAPFPPHVCDRPRASFARGFCAPDGSGIGSERMAPSAKRRGDTFCAGRTSGALSSEST